MTFFLPRCLDEWGTTSVRALATYHAKSHDHRTDNRRCFLLLFGNRTEQLSLVVLQLIQQEKDLLVVLRCQNDLPDLSLATGLPLPRFRRSQLIQQVEREKVLKLGCAPSVDLGSQVQLEVEVET